LCFFAFLRNFELGRGEKSKKRGKSKNVENGVMISTQRGRSKKGEEIEEG
jgi:hypothetical protein